MPKDEFGIEYDNDVEAALKDPKGGLIAKVFDYLNKREAAKATKEAEERAAKEKKENKGVFGGIFGNNF